MATWRFYINNTLAYTHNHNSHSNVSHIFNSTTPAGKRIIGWTWEKQQRPTNLYIIENTGLHYEYSTSSNLEDGQDHDFHAVLANIEYGIYSYTGSKNTTTKLGSYTVEDFVSLNLGEPTSPATGWFLKGPGATGEASISNNTLIISKGHVGDIWVATIRSVTSHLVCNYINTDGTKYQSHSTTSRYSTMAHQISPPSTSRIPDGFIFRGYNDFPFGQLEKSGSDYMLYPRNFFNVGDVIWNDESHVVGVAINALYRPSQHDSFSIHIKYSGTTLFGFDMGATYTIPASGGRINPVVSGAYSAYNRMAVCVDYITSTDFDCTYIYPYEKVADTELPSVGFFRLNSNGIGWHSSDTSIPIYSAENPLMVVSLKAFHHGTYLLDGNILTKLEDYTYEDNSYISNPIHFECSAGYTRSGYFVNASNNSSAQFNGNYITISRSSNSHQDTVYVLPVEETPIQYSITKIVEEASEILTTYNIEGTVQINLGMPIHSQGLEFDNWVISGDGASGANIVDNVLYVSLGTYGDIIVTASWKNGILLVNPDGTRQLLSVMLREPNKNIKHISEWSIIDE